jgi:proton glutamate symport protein
MWMSDPFSGTNRRPRSGGRLLSPSQWMLVAVVVGLGVGLLFPDRAGAAGFRASDLAVVSTLFLRMVKSLIAPLVFATLVVGIAGHGSELKGVGTLAVRSIV